MPQGDDDFVLTPWDSRGDIDYERLSELFGVKIIGDDLRGRLARMAGEDHFMLRRGVFFSHRDLEMILDSQESGRGFFMYTGRGPSGSTHIGHLVPWAFARWLQDRFGTTIYFQITDDEKFYAKPDLTLDQTRDLAYDNALDFAALGFDPLKTHILIDTRDIRTLYPLAAQVAKRINYSNTKATFGFRDDTNIGMIFYTALQSAPCFLEDRPVLIPLGVDQDPHFRLTRDVAPLLRRPKPALVHNMMIPGLRGPGGKMSSSDTNSAVYTTDTPSQVRRKINRYAYSGGRADVEEHRRMGGNPDVDVSFQYLRMFFEPDDSGLGRIREEYAAGRMLTGELKQILIEKASEYLEEHRSRREAVDLGEFLYDGDDHKDKMRR